MRNIMRRVVGIVYEEDFFFVGIIIKEIKGFVMKKITIFFV